MTPGIAIALLAYGLFSCADALIKGTAGELSIFQVGFFTSLFGMLPALLSKRPHERWAEAVKMNSPALLHLRGLSGVLGSLCVIYAFTHVPLAEVYSLAFLAPMFVVILSAMFLHETIPARRWPLLLLSFVGVLVVVRPGFHALEAGHFAAIGCAFFTASNTILLRSLSAREHRLTIFGVVTVYALLANGIGMLLTTASMPRPAHLLILLSIGLLGGIGHLLFIGATRLTPANQLAPAQYSQMIWAVALGAAFFGEYLDLHAAFGISILVIAGLLNMMSNGPTTGYPRSSRLPEASRPRS